MKRFILVFAVLLIPANACTSPPTLTPVPPTATALQPTSTPTVLPIATLAQAPRATLLAVSPTPTLKPLSLEDRNRVFEQAWVMVRDKWIHNDDFGGMSWQQVHDEYAPRIASAPTPESFYMLMREFIGKLGDNFSRFLSPQEVASMNQPQSNAEVFGGIGATLKVIPEGAVILEVVQGGPADLAGLKASDTIQAIDGLAYSTLEASNPGSGIAAIRGTVGTSVRLSVISPDGKLRSVDVTRALISFSPTPQSPTRVSLLPGTHVGLLQINTFNSSDVPTQVKTELQRLMQAGAMDGLIIDLRRNGGGMSKPMLETLALFNDGGSIGAYAGGKTSTQINVARGTTISELKSVPMVVLTSQDTREGAEIFAVGMQVLRRARIVGIPSAGVVNVSETNTFADGSRLQLLEAIYRPPDGTPVEGRGVQPDHVVDSKWYLYIDNPGNDPQVKAAMEELKKK